jgi:hypothetical protein
MLTTQISSLFPSKPRGATGAALNTRHTQPDPLPFLGECTLLLSIKHYYCFTICMSPSSSLLGCPVPEIFSTRIFWYHPPVTFLMNQPGGKPLHKIPPLLPTFTEPVYFHFHFPYLSWSPGTCLSLYTTKYTWSRLDAWSRGLCSVVRLVDTGYCHRRQPKKLACWCLSRAKDIWP